MVDGTGASATSHYEHEVTAGRKEIAEVLHGVEDGILTGVIRLGAGSDAVAAGVPDDLSLEIEFEEDDDEMSLELELEWPTPNEGSTASPVEVRPEGTAEATTPVGAANGSASQARFEVFRDRGDEWRWRLRHRNGNVIAISGEGYTQKHNAQKGLRSVIENSSAAEITETSTD